jgi:hypothetical protein
MRIITNDEIYDINLEEYVATNLRRPYNIMQQ